MNEQSSAFDELDNQIFLAEESLTEISFNRNSKGIISKNLPETRALELLTKSPKHQYLLKHPVFMSFMWLKWERIHHTYSGNLRFYTLFTYILTWFIFDKFGYDRTDKGENSLIFIVTGFIFIFLMISIIKAFCTVEKELSNMTRIIFLIIETLAIVGCLSLIMTLEAMKQELHLNIFLLVFTIILIFREAFQLLLSVKKYICQKENWIEILMISLIIFILIPHTNQEISRILSGFVIVLSWADLIILIAKHPNMTR